MSSSRSKSKSSKSQSSRKIKSQSKSKSKEKRSKSKSKSKEKRKRSSSYQRNKSSQRTRRYPISIPKSAKLFIANIDASLNSQQVKKDLEAQFNKFGEVKQINIRTKRGSANSYAFVQFKNQDDAEAALKGLNGKQFKGKQLKVQFGKGQRKQSDRRGDKCYICHRQGHFANDCRYRDRERDRYDSRDYHRRRKYSRSSSSESDGSYRRKKSYDRQKDRDYRRKDDRSREYRRSPERRKQSRYEKRQRY